MPEKAEKGASPPPSPSPPRSLLASPVPSSPSPRANGDQDSPRSESSRAVLPRRPPIHSHFQVTWRQNQTTGLMTLVSTPTTSPSTLSAISLSDDSDNEEEREVEGSNKEAAKPRVHSWRNKERMKTTGVAIALCLNLGTDPPDSDKVAPCARTECGIDPTKFHFDSNPYPTLKMISSQLEEQFRNLQPRARIKLAADPTVDMIRKTCTGLRKAAKNERVLVHFNGHGVPRPTRSGEIWAFNEDFTQYIPLSIFDLIRWTGHPAMFTFDCSAAGQLIPHFLDHERDNERKYRQQLEEYKKNKAKRKKEQERRDRRERENERLVRMARAQNGVLLASTLAAASAELPSQESGSEAPPSLEEVDQRPVKKTFIVLVPCGADETLPSSPQLPADLFTCCLTVPVQTALRWFILQNRLTMEPLGIEQGMVNLIPGKASERKTMLGELNWIFTAVTDTIAWSVLPRKLFQRLFRQDLLVASMLRHFLLAERVFRTLGCTPQSLPLLPPTWKHRMWDAWDQAVECCLTQLPSLIPARVLSENGFHRAARIAAERQGLLRIPSAMAAADSLDALYQQQAPEYVQENHVESRFFKDQLQAFETWLSLPSSSRHLTASSPEQLPVVLQVLLSHQHRFVALDQLARFLDLGPWAVSHALSVGVFPYVLKLLQSPLPTLKSFLVRIWVRILDLDPTCRDDLNQAKEQRYFIRQLESFDEPDHASRSALVLCISCDGDANSKMQCLAQNLDRACAAYLEREDAVSPLTTRMSGSVPGRGHPSFTQNRFHEPGSSESEDADSDSEGSDERSRPVFSHVQQVFSGTSESFSPVLRNGYRFGGTKRRLKTRDTNLVRWSCLTLAKFWEGFELGRARALNARMDKALERLLAEDENPEVREAAAYALGMLLGPLYMDPPPQPVEPSPMPQTGAVPSVGISSTAAGGSSRSSPTPTVREEKTKSSEMCDAECDLAVRLLKLGRQDGSPLVRREILYAVSRFVTDSAHLGSVQFTVHILSEFRSRSSQTQQDLIDRLHSTFGSRGPKYMAIWLDLTRMFAVDPFPAVSQVAQILTRFVKGGVDARIEAIRGRAGEAGLLNAAMTAAPAQDNTPLALLESDLFARAKRQMCRCRQELEDDTFYAQVREVTVAKRLKEDHRAVVSWSKECLNWVGQNNRICWDYFHGQDESNDSWDEDEDDYANPRNLKAPFLQLLKTLQQEAEAMRLVSGHGASAAPGTGGIMIAGNRQRQGYGQHGGPSGGGPHSGVPGAVANSSSQHSDHDSELSQIFRQSSQSLASLSGGTGPSGSSGNRFLGGWGGSGHGDKQGQLQPQHRLEEVRRVEFGKQTAVSLNSPHQSYVSTFHPYSAQLFVAMQQSVSCYDFTNVRPQTSKFSNLNIAASSITAVTWIDCKTDPLLLTSSDDGHVRVWRDATTANANLVTAFSPFGVAPTVAAATTATTSSSSSLTPVSPDRRVPVKIPLIDWVPESSHLLCTSSFSSSLRVWDLVTEQLLSDMIFASPSKRGTAPPITSLSSSEYSSVFAASFADGTTRLFDRRMDDRFACIEVRASPHQEPIVETSRISKSNCMATVAASGEVRVWDIRMEAAVLVRSQFKADSGDNIYAFHPNAPILACAPRKSSGSSPIVKLLSFDDVELCQVRLKTTTSGSSTFGFMGTSKQVRDITSLAWHSKEIALCVGTADFAAIHVAPNTRVRGVWSPSQLTEPAFSGYVGLTSNNSHHSSSNISLS